MQQRYITRRGAVREMKLVTVICFASVINSRVMRMIGDVRMDVCTGRKCDIKTTSVVDQVDDSALRWTRTGQVYANALTSGMGIITFMFLWIPLPLLHMSSIEPFEWPSDMKTLLAIGGIALSALTFLTTFMVSIKGPIILSKAHG